MKGGQLRCGRSGQRQSHWGIGFGGGQYEFFQASVDSRGEAYDPCTEFFECVEEPVDAVLDSSGVSYDVGSSSLNLGGGVIVDVFS